MKINKKLYLILSGLCLILSASLFAQTPAKISPEALVGSYECFGWDHASGDYTVSNLDISLDKKMKENSDCSLGYYSYKMEITSSSIPGSYVGAMIIDPINLTGADFLGGNKERQEDYGTGLVNINSVLEDGRVASFTIIYYQPKYHNNGTWTCINKLDKQNANKTSK